MKKIYIASFVVALAIIGAYFFPRPAKIVGFGTTGDVNTTPREVQVSLDLSTTTPTAGLACNNDGRSRIITSAELYFTALKTIYGATNPGGIAAWNFTMSTSTGVYTPDSGNYVLNTNVSTTTAPILFISSTSPGTIGISTANDFARVWATGTCLNLLENATSTTATGFLTIHYRMAP